MFVILWAIYSLSFAYKVSRYIVGRCNKCDNPGALLVRRGVAAAGAVPATGKVVAGARGC
jgi:hypothetical protein